VIVAQNVVAHNYNALQFLKNVRAIMPDNGYFFMQISQVDMIRRNEFDTCYHEHINFFNVLSLIKIADRAGLFIQDIVKQPIHGNSYIVVFHKTKGQPHRIGNLLALDRSDGMNDLRRYEFWGQNAHRLMDELRTAVATAREQGFKVVGYGAAAKGMTEPNANEMRGNPWIFGPGEAHQANASAWEVLVEPGSGVWTSIGPWYGAEEIGFKDIPVAK
jgi:hypothetical protein